MPLDTHIAAFLTASAKIPPPLSLEDMRAATETGLRQLQGKKEAEGRFRDFIVIADDCHRLTLRAYEPAGASPGNALRPWRRMVSGLAVVV